jgi:hypothetical protein
MLFILFILLFSCSAPKADVAPRVDIPQKAPEQPAPPIKNPIPGFIRWDEQEEFAINAIQRLPEFERQQTRFITCADQFNADGVDSVQECKDGVVKALNSISTEVDIADVQTIGPANSIMMVRLTDFGITRQKWQAIENADPFKFTSQTIRGQTLQFLTQSIRPLMNGHNFAEVALNNVYYDLVGVPTSFAAFQQQIGANIQADFDERDPAVNVWGMNESVITANRQFRLIYRTESRDGSLWCTEDTDDQVIAPVQIDGQLVNQKNLLEAPFPNFARSAKAFVFNAGECIFTLPNGMLGFALFDAAGRRQNFAPTNIVQDTAAASVGLSGTIQNARSCSRCHADGIVPIKDSIGSHIASSASFNANDKQLGRIFFRSDAVGSAMIKEENSRFQRALRDLSISGDDPVNGLVDKLRLEQDARQVAGMLGITEDELLGGLASSAASSATLGALLRPNGKVNFQQLVAGLPILIAEMKLFEDDI